VIILGLDIATSTGVCWMDTAKEPRDWRVLAVSAEGEFQEEKTGDLAVYLSEEFAKMLPDFVAIEMPRRDVAAYPKQVPDHQRGGMKTIWTVNADQLLLPALASAATATCDLAGVPWGLVSSRTWRPAFYGKGFKAESSEAWKKAAVDRARMLGIVLPGTKKAQMDAAEAVGVAWSWQKCTQIATRHHQSFVDLRIGKVAA
jgi:hypothetical protein